MRLTIMDRFAILGILPKQGSFLQLATSEEIKEKVNFSKEEREEAHLREPEPGKVQWERELIKDLKFDDKETALVTEQLTKLDKSGNLAVEHIEIYRKFMLGAKEVEEVKDAAE